MKQPISITLMILSIVYATPRAMGFLTTRPAQDEPIICLVVDEDSIDNGTPPNFFSAADVNDDIAEIGVRAPLRYWTQNIGKQITLYTGSVGDEGWFILPTIPASWYNAGPTTDGLVNYMGVMRTDGVVRPGPGLGMPNADGDREFLLDKVPDVSPLHQNHLEALIGRKVFALVYDSDVSINYNPLEGSLKGANLGVVAFRVNDVRPLPGGSSSALPQMDITILDPTLLENMCTN
jgi:hypothetical protein